jgi:hypothetical protein
LWQIISGNRSYEVTSKDNQSYFRWELVQNPERWLSYDRDLGRDAVCQGVEWRSVLEPDYGKVESGLPGGRREDRPYCCNLYVSSQSFANLS